MPETSRTPARSRIPAIALALALTGLAPASSQDAPRYLFSYFTGNGESGLHLAASADGLHWTALNDGGSFLTPQVGSKLMRDPSIVRAPDGTFHMVWTTGWWDKGIGYARSPDLVTWSEQRWLPVMEHEPTAVNTWAPDLFYDEDTTRFLIVWASTIPGRFPMTEDSGDVGNEQKLNHRLYCVTTTDFETFTPTRLFYDGGFNVIDGTIFKAGDEYVMIVKDETLKPVAKKNLRVTRAAKAEGPYGPASPPISVDWVEGPTVLRVGDGWIVYYDEYTRKRYGALRSRDLNSWHDISDSIGFPQGTRHGTAFEAGERVIRGLGQVRSGSGRISETAITF